MPCPRISRMDPGVPPDPHHVVPADDDVLTGVIRGIDPGRYRFAYLGTNFVRGAEIEGRMKQSGMTVHPTGRLLAETAKELKDDYVKLVGELERRNPLPSWWATSVSGQVPYGSFSFINICWLFMVKALCGSVPPSVPYFIVVESIALEESLRRLYENGGMSCVRIHRRPLRRRLWKRIAVGKRFADSRRRLFAGMLKRKLRVGGIPPRLRNRRFSRSVAIVRSWLTERSVRNGGYQEHFFPGLPDFLKSRGFEVVTLLDLLSLEGLGRILQLQSEGREDILLYDQLLTWGDLLRLFWEIAIRPEYTVEPADIRGVDVTPMLRWELRMDHAAGDPCYSLIQWHAMRRLSQMGWPVKAIYYPFENQPWEQFFCYSARRHLPGAWRAGYQHSHASGLWLSYHRSLDRANGIQYPDTILCNGGIPAELFKRMGHANVQTCYPIRYVHLEKALKRSDPGSRENCFLVTTPIGIQDTLEVCCRAAALFRSADCRVRVKLHPSLDRNHLKGVLDRLSQAWPGHFQFEDRALEEVLPSCRAVLSANSTTLVEALAYSCVPVNIPTSCMYDLAIIDDPLLCLDLKPDDTYSDFLAQLPEFEERIRLHGKDYVRRLFDYTSSMDAFLPLA